MQSKREVVWIFLLILCLLNNPLTSAITDYIAPSRTYIEEVYDKSYSIEDLTEIGIGINNLELKGQAKSGSSSEYFELNANNLDGNFYVKMGDLEYTGQGLHQLHFFTSSGSQILQSVIGVPSDSTKTAYFSVFFNAHDTESNREKIMGSLNGWIEFINGNQVQDFSINLNYLNYIDENTKNHQLLYQLELDSFDFEERINDLENWKYVVDNQNNSNENSNNGEDYNLTEVTDKIYNLENNQFHHESRIFELESWKQFMENNQNSSSSSSSGGTFYCFDTDEYGCDYDCSLNPNNKTGWSVENHLSWLYYQDCHNTAKISNLTNQSQQENNYEERRFNLELNQSNQETRISSLESWKQTIDEWKNTITTQISEIILSITGLITKTNNHEERIENLENSGYVGDGSPYLQYLSKSDKKKMLCGYMKENMLTELNDLGMSCTASYKTYSSGRIRQRCRCK